MSKDTIIIAGAREHNLKNIHLNLPREKLIVVTGLSGSGKSSLAFDTIYAEGQRKYVESLSAYARQFLEQLQKPDVDYIEGLSPAIAIEQRFAGNNPRSTIATTTEIYEYLRLLFANIGKPHCYRCGRPITTQTTSQIVDQILGLGEGTQLMLLAPLIRGRKGEFRDVFARIKREGFVRARVDGEILDVTEPVKLDKRRNHSIELVVDRLIAAPKTRARLADSVETTLKWGSGLLMVLYRTATTPVTVPWSERLFSSQNACPECGISYGEFTPRHFSFNSPDGACRTCHGLGTKLFIDPDLVVPDRNKSVASGAIAAWRRGGRRLLNAVGRREPAHPPRLADRLGPDRRALRARRAVDRPAPARQRALLDTLRRLRDLGNTVIVVEHDEDAILAADLCRRHRPRRRRPRRRHRRQGHAGGDHAPNPESLTGQYLVACGSCRRRRAARRRARPRG
jgi:excinuclease ABC subunit A